jgi:NADP-dependent 3-hydroxy acid dehydrogenase YdfG
MESIFKTSLNAALAVLPRMRTRHAGTIAFITSIGGKIGVPHHVPYSVA